MIHSLVVNVILIANESNVTIIGRNFYNQFVGPWGRQTYASHPSRFSGGTNVIPGVLGIYTSDVPMSFSYCLTSSVSRDVIVLVCFDNQFCHRENFCV